MARKIKGKIPKKKDKGSRKTKYSSSSDESQR